eukprot:CAMPEP_0115875260 /NCGR_PEP_ID=MMETSP0287-20121206/25003_1 /TAXON_ID=412157 /ORGANISM="Chrysochromulina rotalis, Strain UIO044" /LENGTH=295 /DNA_ID=CAMNT_0003330513 /DNA_START=49 /DNA_END=936 /DNA_ORIENTATION=+
MNQELTPRAPRARSMRRGQSETQQSREKQSSQPQQEPQPQSATQQGSGLELLRREHALRAASIRERALRHRQDVAERSRHIIRMPRGRAREDGPSGSASSRSALDKSRGHGIVSWAERLKVSRARAATQPHMNPHAYKAALDRGRIHVVTNWSHGYAGKGAERYATGDLYVGDIRSGEREGRGLYQLGDGQLLVSEWRSNEPIGEGVQWSADKSYAVRIVDGKPERHITDKEARQIAKRLGAPTASNFHHARPFTWGISSNEEFDQGDVLNAAKARRQAPRSSMSPLSPGKAVRV